ncbi:MAG: hypothetical protein KDA24_16935 [Deltaproteobacteria bacterium]|nr:hypothetical protein [Deltaproteobacteria bacterium]
MSKIRRKSKKRPAPSRASSRPPAGTPETRRLVRLRKSEALELANICHGAGLEAAKQHLRFLRPHLDEVAVHEVAWRCQDPQGRGGVQTGTDSDGEYADLAVTA